jgi:hypothetical protein
MPNSQNILTYPIEMLDALLEAGEGGRVVYPCVSHTDALTLRSRFYTLRKLIQRDPDALYDAVRVASQNVTFNIVGRTLTLETKSAYMQRKLPTRSQS